MTTKTINIFSQDDTEHQLFINELEAKIPGIVFHSEYISNPNADKLTDSNPILSKLNEDVAIIKVNSLPFPLNSNIKILAAIKSENSNVFAVLAKDKTYSYLFKPFDSRNTFGKVHLVGAGQSNKDLLSLKSHALIKNADIIFYDSLIDKSILKISEAEKVFVGKRANIHYREQADINELLYEAALKHKTIVRLKGGDPMIFGHAGEEIAFLEARLIKVETIPGVSSPLGAASMANLPLTLRNISNSVSFCSAHEKSKILVPETDTIVYFMGATNLKNIAETLKKKEKPSTTPVTLFYNIGAKDQQVYYETIDSLINENKEFKSPLLAVVGEIGNKKNWHKSFEYKPKILFTGTHIKKYADLGYVFHQPMIEIAALDNLKELDYVVESLHSYEWIVFTSMYAAEHFLKSLFDLGHDSRYLANLKIASIGKVTSKQLKKFGITPDLQATEESSEGLIKLFKKKNITTSSILIPRSNLAHNYLPDALQELGNSVNKLVVYTNRMPKVEKKVEIENFDKVIFTSPSGVDNFYKTYRKLPQQPEVITRGKETQKRIDFYRKKK